MKEPFQKFPLFYQISQSIFLNMRCFYCLSLILVKISATFIPNILKASSHVKIKDNSKINTKQLSCKIKMKLQNVFNLLFSIHCPQAAQTKAMGCMGPSGCAMPSPTLSSLTNGLSPAYFCLP